MILTCPQCATRYQIDGGKFPAAGRTVRCTKCGETWFQPPPAPEPDPSLAPASSPTPTPEVSPPPGAVVAAAPREAAPSVRKPRRPGDRAAIVAGWIALAGIAGLLVWGGIRYRDTIATVWPRSSTLYAALGLPVNARGIAFDNVNYRREIEDGRSVLVVRGLLRNVVSREIAVPRIQVSLTDSENRRLDSWVFSPGVERLGPGQTAPFVSRRTAPPEDARHLEITFASSGG